MKKVLLCLSMGVLVFMVFGGLDAQAQNAVANPFFTTMDLQHWTATDPSYSCVVNMNQGMIYYCLKKYPGTPSNNGAIVQDVHLIAGNTYEFSANIASKYCSSWGGISDGGRFAVRINGTLIASHEFGYVSGATPEAAVLEGKYTPATSGLYTLEIKNNRPAGTSTSNLINYLDNIVLASTTPMLSADGQTISSFFGSTRNFELTAGAVYAGHDYWLWIGCSGTYPGIKLSGVDIPLNYDILVELGLLYPGFPGTGFVGQLDGSGNASASMKIMANPNYQGATMWLSYLVLSAGMKTPVLTASNPINVTFTLME